MSIARTNPIEIIRSSQITSYLRCPESYRRAYIEKDIVPPPFAMHRGTAIHKGAEHNFSQKIESHEDLPAKEIVEIAVETLRSNVKIQGVLLGLEEKTIGIKKLLNETERSVVTLAGLFSRDVGPRHQPTAVEKEVELPIPIEGIYLQGRLDLVTDRQKIVDLKTSTKRSTPESYHQSVPLTTYAFTYQVLNQSPPDGIEIDVLIDKKEPETQIIETSRRREDFVALVEQIKAVAHGIKSSVFPGAYGQYGAWWCSPDSCGYWQTCKFVPAHKRG